MRWVLIFVAFEAVANALASNKPLHRSSRVESLMLGSGVRLDQINGSNIWGICSEQQLEGDWKPLHSDRCMNVNMAYVRIPKCGSTSFTSVLRRISARYGVSGVDAREPQGLREPFLSSFHEQMEEMQDLVNNAVKPVVKITMIRDPIDRAISQFYYAATKFKSLEDKGIVDFLKHHMDSNFEYGYLLGKKGMNVDEVVDQYALVGLSERFDESVVMLMEMFGLSYCDVIFSSGKISADAVTGEGKKFLPTIPRSEQPQDIQDFLASAEFQGSMQLDLQIYDLAKKRFDARIDQVGREQFAAKVEDFRKWKGQVLEACKADLGSGDHAWRESHCYVGDFGCGYKCFDSVCEANPK
jgi:hypothetical protein